MNKLLFIFISLFALPAFAYQLEVTNSSWSEPISVASDSSSSSFTTINPSMSSMIGENFGPGALRYKWQLYTGVGIVDSANYRNLIAFAPIDRFGTEYEMTVSATKNNYSVVNITMLGTNKENLCSAVVQFNGEKEKTVYLNTCPSAKYPSRSQDQPWLLDLGIPKSASTIVVGYNGFNNFCSVK